MQLRYALVSNRKYLAPPICTILNIITAEVIQTLSTTNMFIIKKGVAAVLDYIYICVHVKVKYFQKNSSNHFPLFCDDFFYNGGF